MSRRHPIVLCSLCIGVGLLGIVAGRTPLLTDAEENIGLHLLYALRGPEAPRANVVVVAIDSESAIRLDLPLTPVRWPRIMHARLIDRLAAAQVAVIAFDMIFHEPQDAKNDGALAAAMVHAGNVVLTQAIDRQTIAVADPAGTRETRLDIERVISAIPVIAEAAAGQAAFPLPKVPIKLNQFWCFRKASGNAPTLPVVVMHVYARNAFADFLRLLADIDAGSGGSLPPNAGGSMDIASLIDLIPVLRSRFEGDPTLAPRMLSALDDLAPQSPLSRSAIMIRRFVTLYGGASSRYLNFYGPLNSIRTIAYQRLVDDTGGNGSNRSDDDLPPLADAAVFVGQSGSNWIKPYDGFYTVFSSQSGKDISGVEVAATAFANLIEGRAVHPLGPAATLLLLMAWGIVGTLLCLRLSPALSAAGLLAISGVYLTMASFRFSAGGTWYPLVVPVMVQSPAAFIASLALKYRNATIERQNIREAFGHYLPDPVVDRLSANMKELKLGGQVFYGICLFTDAQNYTTLAETMDPDRLTRLMNAYYDTIFTPIKANGGLVLQVVGDSVLAIWTASQPDEALKTAACRAATGIIAAVAAFNRDAGMCAMPTRIGIHAGEILLGNIGTIDHFEYRPVGDIVNTASRVEGLNKFLGTRLLVSEEAMATENGILARSVGHFVFKGKSRPVHVYELQPSAPDGPDGRDEAVRLFAAGLDAFRRGDWASAERLFAQVLDLDATDGPARFYRAHCHRFSGTLPDADWDGAVRLERK